MNNNYNEINFVRPLLGSIDTLHNGDIYGWLAADIDVEPMLLIDGVSAQILEWPISRLDVKDSLGGFEYSGFRFAVTGLKRESNVELFAIHHGRVHKICEKRLNKTQFNNNIFAQILRAKELSLHGNSVGITCWEGSHNPIGRAKVLYDIAKVGRSAVIFSYIFDDFGSNLWPPLRDQDIDIVLIPWKERLAYHKLIQQMSISFDTIWMCKPRFPTFELGSLISKPNSKLILDIDDNEEPFMSSSSSLKKAYGFATQGVAFDIAKKIESKTVSNISLKNRFGGEIIRHTREDQFANDLTSKETESIKIIFIGTVRPHKGILSAARALLIFQEMFKVKVQLHVYGDISPESAKEALIDAGVVISGIIPSSELFSAIYSSDIVLGGYPSGDDQYNEITKYQITAKIGDALVCKRPILVPRSESLEDLNNVLGVYQFDRNDFYIALTEAINVNRKKIFLPTDFTTKSAYKKFKEIEHKTKKNASLLKAMLPIHILSKSSSDKSILLIWKQNDAGLYGRRIDQIARSYKTKFPKRNVYVLEILHQETEKRLGREIPNWFSDARLILESSKQKSEGGYIDNEGVVYKQIKINTSEFLNKEFIYFLSECGLTPDNTTIIVFPKIQFLEKIINTLQSYKLIVDVVDNQFSWTSNSEKKYLQAQYGALFSIAHHVIFNSSVNLDFFKSTYSPISKLDTWHLIPNWYQLPSEFNKSRNKKGKYNGLVYSGNFNDRINWELLLAVANQFPAEKIHLIGTAERVSHYFIDLIKRSNVVYHGPLPEIKALEIVASSRLALIPHLKDQYSNYMSPLKILMYVTLGLPIISTDVAGIESEYGNIILSKDSDHFISSIANSLELKPSLNLSSPIKNNFDSYLSLLDPLHS